MATAKDVREKVEAYKTKYDIYDEAQSIFNWIVDSIDSTEPLIKSGKFNAYMPINSSSIEVRNFPNLKFNIPRILDKDGIIRLFKVTKSLIDDEEGYNADFTEATLHLESGDCIKCIRFTVIIS